MSVEIYTRKIKSSSATEIYISAVPKVCARTQSEIAESFAGIRKLLSSEKANILQERIFITDGAMDTVLAARRQAYGEIDDGVLPSFLSSSIGRLGAMSGVQVHAVAGPKKPEIVKLDGKACGRIMKMPGHTYVALSAITGGNSGKLGEQAIKMLENGESILKQLGGDFRCVPRTWMWLGDILSWYGEFNGARNQFFVERGLIGKGSRMSMPASTGIGLGLSKNGHFGMDLTAVLEPKGSIEFLGAIGRQQCALEYGSAFSRASRCDSPAGKTVFVSGTASIDAKGTTTNLGDAKGQVEATIENVRAVLRDMNCSDKDVVAAIAYSKTPEVDDVFEEFRSRLDWPWITAICDICRDDLLFEIEATAIPQGAK
jgi:enamine deaminase RidA (YjgF/YER057c/UK114 family)